MSRDHICDVGRKKCRFFLFREKKGWRKNGERETKKQLYIYGCDGHARAHQRTTKNDEHDDDDDGSTVVRSMTTVTTGL